MQTRRVLLEFRDRLAGGNFEGKEAILHARGPILKLRFGDLEVDLSVNNRRPLANTQLLKAYSSLHGSIAGLGIAVKLWSKEHGLCGAASGHLSSYAWMLMVIYFLQVAWSTPLPCLPVEKFETAGAVKTLEDIQWTCAEPMHELLHGFFDFYTTKFHWGKEVVTVRYGRRESVSASVQRLQKRRGSHLCIEDPFDIDRDLADVLQETQEAQMRFSSGSAAQFLQHARWRCGDYWPRMPSFASPWSTPVLAPSSQPDPPPPPSWSALPTWPLGQLPQTSQEGLSLESSGPAHLWTS